MTTAAMNRTYRIIWHCEPGCVVDEMDHFDQPGTGYLWCSEHGEVAGTLDDAP